MNARPAVYLLAFLLAVTGMTCSARWKAKDRFEGIKDGKLRVCVRIPNTDELEYGDARETVDARLVEEARRRGDILLGRQIRLDCGEGNECKKALDGIAGALKEAKIVNAACGDDFCEGFIDFNITTLSGALKEAEKPAERKNGEN